MKLAALVSAMASVTVVMAQTVQLPRPAFHEIKWSTTNVDSQAWHYLTGQVEVMNTRSRDTLWRTEYFMDGSLALRTAVTQAWRLDTAWTISPISYLDTTVYDSGYFDYRFGPYREFYQDGQVKLRGDYVNGLATGDWQAWDSAGNLQWEFRMNRGVYDGPFTKYHPNGKKAIRGAYRLRVSGSYVGTRNHGTWKYWDEDGKLLRKEKHPQPRRD
jgi:hypothetical protein